MTNLRKETRTSLARAALAIVLLLIANAMVLSALESEARREVSGNMLARLDTMVKMLDLMNTDAMARVKTIAEEPRLKQMTKGLIRAPGNPVLGAEFAAWITPIYQSRGFIGYTLIEPDSLTVVMSGSPAYIGQKIATQSTKDAIAQAKNTGTGIGRPTLPPRLVITFNTSTPPDQPYQNVCSRIDEGDAILGYLCLRANPALHLYRVLDAARNGATGESYVIDAEARILSPIRFEGDLAAPSNAKTGWSSLKVFARVPGRANEIGKPEAVQKPDRPATRVAAALLQQKNVVGLLDDYPDYRGHRVVGTGKWLPEMHMGLIVEEDMEEAYRSFRYARLALECLVAIAVFLVIGLTLAQLRARRSLARNEQQLAAFRDHMPGGMLMKDAQGRYLMVNPVFEKLFGVSPRSWLGKTNKDFVAPEEAEVATKEELEILRTGQSRRHIYTHRGEDGEETIYHLVRFPIPDEDGENVAGIGLVGVDMTDQVKAQHALEELTQTLEKKVVERTAQLAEARDQAEAASRAKAEFLANMSHEIRTPLNAIIGMSHLAAEVNTAPRISHYLQRIQSSSRHLLGIVNDILDLSKIEAGKLSIDAVEFSLERMLEHVAGLVWERAEAKGLELIISIEPSLPDRLLGDPMRLGQILINFANNAVKFTESGEVVLRVNSRGGENGSLRLRFEVEDTGIGIAEDKLPLLFAPFQQLDSSMARRFEGTGLGLAISRSLAELMGGEVGVESQFGQGSLFFVEVTLHVLKPTTALIMPSIDLRNRHALVVDDNAHARGQLAILLRSLSFRVDEAACGQEAIDRIAEADAHDCPFEVAFIDWKMPDLSGHETATQIRLLSLRGTLPKMVLIAPGTSANQELAEQGQFDAVLGKPVTPSEVFDTAIAVFSEAPATKWSSSGHDARWECLKGRSVLLVEDNSVNQEVVHDLLALVGVQVTIAGDGMQALQILNNRPFDMVLMDVHMPIMNGFETTAAIRKNPLFAALPIIALTANALDGDRERCLEAGMDDYIAKPIDPKQMFATLARYCPGKELPKTESVPEQASPQAASGNDVQIIAAFSAIPELDFERGLSGMMGRANLYAKLAQRVATERADLPHHLQAAMAAGDLAQVGDLIHGVKSILGALGATRLQQTCIDIEKRLGEGSPIESALAEFSSGYSGLMAKLAQATSKNEHVH